MRLGKSALAAVAAVSLVGAPVIAQASSAQRAADTSEEEGFAGIALPILLIGAAAVIGGIVAVADSKDNSPTSP
ncbi:hypothetical protein LPB140_09830 [Sphingorhabdus lutea]|uniref:Secreted protein n=1 Tax=Sphingorhabdus lutea TaxID=1913578 RepID=A0A1L3JD09_9SPHN|nr:hypothetical protein [Sphingorhabdus lutea]APG63037.1 hypothetical protein LPB140_09830 [Sphingorhabdus lutea]